MAYFENNTIKNCTRCGKEFSDLRMQVSLNLYTERLRDSGIWEEIPNLCQESVEYLCPECFSKWVDIQAQMDIPYQENPRYQDVDQHATDKYRYPNQNHSLSDPYAVPTPNKGTTSNDGNINNECPSNQEATPAFPNFEARIEELCRRYEKELKEEEETDYPKQPHISNSKGVEFTEELHSNEPEVVPARYMKPDFD